MQMGWTVSLSQLCEHSTKEGRWVCGEDRGMIAAGQGMAGENRHIDEKHRRITNDKASARYAAREQGVVPLHTSLASPLCSSSISQCAEASAIPGTGQMLPALGALPRAGAAARTRVGAAPCWRLEQAVC